MLHALQGGRKARRAPECDTATALSLDYLLALTSLIARLSTPSIDAADVLADSCAGANI